MRFYTITNISFHVKDMNAHQDTGMKVEHEIYQINYCFVRLVSNYTASFGMKYFGVVVKLT